MFLLILLYVILTIIRPQDYLPALAGVPLLSGVLALAFLCWLGSSSKTFAAPHFILLPAFMLAVMVSQVANGWVGGAIDQLRQFGPNVVAFFILASAVAVSRQHMRTTLMVFTLCALVLAAHGVDQAQHGIGWTGVGLAEDGRIQYVGIFHDPNDLGMLFVTVLPMAVYLSGEGGGLRRIFWLSGAALLLYGIYLTNSRGAMLAVLVVGGGYTWRRYGLASAGTLAVVGLIVMRLLSSRMQELDADESSAAGRVDAWYEGMHMFLSKPLFGVGAGNFTDYNYLTAHNSFMLVLAETGLFGFITWLAFVGYSFWMMAMILRAAAPSPPSTESLENHSTRTELANMHRRRMHGNMCTSVPSTHALVRPDQTNPASRMVRMHTDDAAARIRDCAAERRLALTLLLSLSGMFAAAFFLSRSYTVVLYLVIAVVVGHYLGVRKRLPDLPELSLARDWWRWIPIALVAIVALFTITELLLHTE